MGNYVAKSETEKKLNAANLEKAGAGSRVRTRTLALLPVAAVLFIASAFATSGEGSSSGISAIMSSLDNVVTLCSKVWALLTGNEYFAMLLGISLLGAGFAIFRWAKRTARH